MNDKIYMKELQHWDGEKFITFDMLEMGKNTITVAVTNEGKISVYEYELMRDENGTYFEYGNACTRINVDDFEVIQDIIE